MSARRRLAVVACALGVAVGAAACGGETTVVTVTTDRLPGSTTATTVPTTTATVTTQATTAATTAPTTTATTTAAADLTGLLPQEGAMPGTNTGSARPMPTADDMINTLYQAGDPSIAAALERLKAAGYRGGALRDDTGTDPQGGIALFRSYVFEVTDDATAVSEARRSVEEVQDTVLLDTSRLEVPGVADATGVTATGSQGGTQLAVAFISFPSGPRVYGLQVVARTAGAIDTDRMVEIARQQAAAAP